MTKTEKLTRQAITRFEAGDHDTARSLFLEATHADPYNQVAWLWLSCLANNHDDQRMYLERVVAIDPYTVEGQRARAGLDQLTSARVSVPSPIPPLTPSAPTNTSELPSSFDVSSLSLAQLEAILAEESLTPALPAASTTRPALALPRNNNGTDDDLPPTHILLDTSQDAATNGLSLEALNSTPQPAPPDTLNELSLAALGMILGTASSSSTTAMSPTSEPKSEPAPEPVAAPEPEPIAAPEPEPIAAPEPEPIAELPTTENVSPPPADQTATPTPETATPTPEITPRISDQEPPSIPLTPTPPTPTTRTHRLPSGNPAEHWSCLLSGKAASAPSITQHFLDELNAQSLPDPQSTSLGRRYRGRLDMDAPVYMLHTSLGTKILVMIAPMGHDLYLAWEVWPRYERNWIVILSAVVISTLVGLGYFLLSWTYQGTTLMHMLAPLTILLWGTIMILLLRCTHATTNRRTTPERLDTSAITHAIHHALTAALVRTDIDPQALQHGWYRHA